MTKKIVIGAVHTVPADLRKALMADPNVLAKWKNLTPLARNEWICWTTIFKKKETRKNHIRRLCVDILKKSLDPAVGLVVLIAD